MTNQVEVPRWLELQAEIDYRMFLLDQIKQQNDKPRTLIDKMIDQATNDASTKVLFSNAKEIIAEIKVLRDEWDALSLSD